MPPTPDGFDFLDGEGPDPLAACRRAGTAPRGMPVAPLLRTASDELEYVLRGPDGSTARGRSLADPLAAVLGLPGSVDSRPSEGLWAGDSPDPLADVMHAVATAPRSPVADRASPDKLLELNTLAEADPLNAAQRSPSGRAGGTARLQQRDPLAGVIEAASVDDLEESPARHPRHRASPGKQLRSRDAGTDDSVVHAPAGNVADLDAALRSFSRKRAAAALDTAAAGNSVEDLVGGGGSLPASPRQRRVKARPAAATRSVGSRRSFACGRATT